MSVYEKMMTMKVKSLFFWDFFHLNKSTQWALTGFTKWSKRNKGFTVLQCDFFSFFNLSHKAKWKWIPVIENEPSEICSPLSEKVQKGRFFCTRLAWKSLKKRKRKGKIVFILATFFWPQKNCLTEEVYLAVMLSKISLDIEMSKLLCRFITIIILHSRPASV